jgi:predicted ATPase
MITRWGLKNFKSIQEANLALAPLTVLTGTNSSGKSSLLQSILLIAQTLAYKDSSCQLVLNGEMVRLGDFETVLSSGADRKILGIEFKVEINPNFSDTETVKKPGSGGNESPPNLQLAMTFAKEKHEVFPLLQELSLSGGDNTVHGSMRIERKNGQDEKPLLEMASGMEHLTLCTIPPTAFKVLNFDLENKTFGIKRRALTGYPTAEHSGCSLKHFLPSEFQWTVDEIGEYAKIVVRFLRNPLNYRTINETMAQKHFLLFTNDCADGISSSSQYAERINQKNKEILKNKAPPSSPLAKTIMRGLLTSSLFPPLRDNFFTEEVTGVIQDILGKAGIPFSAVKNRYFLGRIESLDDLYKDKRTFDERYSCSLVFFPAFKSWFASQAEEEQNKIKSCFADCADLEDRIYDAATRTHHKFVKELGISAADKPARGPDLRSYPGVKSVLKQSLRDLDKTGGLDETISDVDKFFRIRVKYLGPLREKPKTIYPFEYASDPCDVGLSGENTAMALFLNWNKVKEYPQPPSDKTGVFAAEKEDSLGNAVRTWLQYLDVADDISAVEIEGSVGISLKVRTKQSPQPYFMNALGVGVSQVLPIVVMGLVSEFDTTMLFEQPELHLHPKVQSRLGDFFLSLAKSGKQCIVETHSEYIIDKLRFRTVAADRDADQQFMRDNVKVYFAQKEAGGTRFNGLEINKYGAISDWPEGFFDEGYKIADLIVDAALKKSAEEDDND